jgi:hypothetical protein
METAIMKRMLAAFLFFLTTQATMAQEKTDTLHIAQNPLQTKWIRPGKNTYLVFFEDSAGRKTRLSLMDRTISFDKKEGKDIIVIDQDWTSGDTSGLRKVLSYVDRKSFAPIYHYTWASKPGVQAFQFKENTIAGVDTVAASTNKTFNISAPEPTLNWELDLETFSTLPYKDNVNFAIPFYHPGGRSAPQFYLYRVSGSEQLTLLNGQKEDCWTLHIRYDEAGTNQATFYISKKTRDVLKMVETFNKWKRYKVKLGVAA